MKQTKILKSLADLSPELIGVEAANPGEKTPLHTQEVTPEQLQIPRPDGVRLVPRPPDYAVRG